MHVRGYRSGDEGEIKTKLRLTNPQPAHKRTRANVISNCFFYLNFSSFFFSFFFQIDHNEHSL